MDILFLLVTYITVWSVQMKVFVVDSYHNIHTHWLYIDQLFLLKLRCNVSILRKNEMGMVKFGGRKSIGKSEVRKFANQNIIYRSRMSWKAGNQNCWAAIEGDNRNIEIPRKNGLVSVN